MRSAGNCSNCIALSHWGKKQQRKEVEEEELYREHNHFDDCMRNHINEGRNYIFKSEGKILRITEKY